VLAFVSLALPAALAASETVGVVTLSTNTSISGSQITIGQSIFSGDQLSVDDGAAEILVGKGSKIILSPHTSASLERDEAGITAVLDHGGISLQQSSQGGLVTRIRSGNVSVAPGAGVPTRAQVFLIDRELTIGARQGAVLVEQDGEQFTVAQDTAVRFVAQDDGGQAGGAGAPAPAAQGAGGPNWGRIWPCALGGAAFGSIPVIVNKLAASPDPAWRWGIIPAGALAGGLICGLGGRTPPPPPLNGKTSSPPPPPPTCALSATLTPGIQGRVTLSWTSSGKSVDLLGYTAAGPNGAFEVDALPQPAPPPGVPGFGPPSSYPHQGHGPAQITYTMVAYGPGGSGTCSASVVLPPAAAFNNPGPVQPERPAVCEQPVDPPKPQEGSLSLVFSGIRTYSKGGHDPYDVDARLEANPQVDFKSHTVEEFYTNIMSQYNSCIQSKNPATPRSPNCCVGKLVRWGHGGTGFGYDDDTEAPLDQRLDRLSDKQKTNLANIFCERVIIVDLGCSCNDSNYSADLVNLLTRQNKTVERITFSNSVNLDFSNELFNKNQVMTPRPTVPPKLRIYDPSKGGSAGGEPSKAQRAARAKREPPRAWDNPTETKCLKELPMEYLRPSTNK
jgi:hypothetical protein